MGRFDDELEELNEELITLGMYCENAIQVVSRALISGDLNGIKKVGELHEEIRNMERKTESFCIRLLLQQQPVASDLRHISSAVRMIVDMERIGDQSDEIAEILKMGNAEKSGYQKNFNKISQDVIKMVKDSVDAYVKKDDALARSVVEYDDVVDDEFDRIKEDLTQIIIEKKMNGDEIIDLLMIAKYYERIGDHAVNIARFVSYSINKGAESDFLPGR